jgi:predicted esterase
MFSQQQRELVTRPNKRSCSVFRKAVLWCLSLEPGISYRLAGYIGISGFILDPAALLRDMNPAVNAGNWLVTHGAQDEMVNVRKTRAQIQTLIDAGFKIDYREYTKGHDIDDQRELPEIREWMVTRLQF